MKLSFKEWVVTILITIRFCVTFLWSELKEEVTEEDEKRARREGWDSASQAKEWIKGSKEQDRFLREMAKKRKWMSKFGNT